jgi:hypothetical protein
MVSSLSQADFVCKQFLLDLIVGSGFLEGFNLKGVSPFALGLINYIASTLLSPINVHIWFLL